eukprot:TRINITY_DN1990_c0_g1_i5.p1 TRINITY_DN1990_c0_g1~~TRINITY_DN1990_c0_g1_i5.p1  ORF type:complete len:848 (+),score=203.21 TRINITY_DN1990_c0_g1_i5:93-2636(+)
MVPTKARSFEVISVSKFRSLSSSSQPAYGSEYSERNFFDILGRKLNILSLDDWYKVRSREVRLQGGSSILRAHGESLFDALAKAYPEHHFVRWKFTRMPNGYWNSKENKTAFFNDLALKLKIKDQDDWYQVSEQEIEEHGGGSLMHYFGDFRKAIVDSYPDVQWDLEKFVTVRKPNGAWQGADQQRDFFDRLAVRLGLQTWQDWYKVSGKTIKEHGGTSVLRYFKDCPSKALMALYPEHPWNPHRFEKVSNKFWQDPANQRKYFDKIGKELNIKHWEDWYLVTREQVFKNAGFTILRYYGDSLMNALEAVYPEHPWKSHKALDIERRSSKAQSHLFKAVLSIFPGKSVHNNFKYQLDQTPIEVDVAVPSLSLAFEYQGEPHFYNVTVFGRDADNVKNNDDRKRQICGSIGVTLIQIPFWWDGTKASLLKTILQHRPELSEIAKVDNADVDFDEAQPIATEIPENARLRQKVNREFNLQAAAAIPKVGTWKNEDPTGWWLSEKLDGVRVLYNGSGRFYARKSRQVIKTPHKFFEGLPETQLEGELCSARGFEHVAGILARGSTAEEDWKDVTFEIFDTLTHFNLPFEHRMSYLESISQNLPATARIVNFWKCSGSQHLSSAMADTTKNNGEGIVLRRPRSTYLQDNCWFIKQEFRDVKAVVLRKDVIGQYYICELIDGKEFVVKMTDSSSDLRVDDVVSFTSTLEEFSAESLKFRRVRPDVVWKDLMRNYWAEKQRFYVSTGSSSLRCVCVSCKKNLLKESLRVQSRILWARKEELPLVITTNVCADITCIQRAVAKNVKNVDDEVFNGVVGYDSRVVSYSQLPRAKDIVWKDLCHKNELSIVQDWNK